MEGKLKNNVAVITGGANGIGYAIAEEFLNEGAKHVILIDINENQGAFAAKILNLKYGEGKAIFFKGDVTKDLEKIYSEIVTIYQNVDILVNSAGVLDELSVRRTIEVNTIATIEWSMKFLENMRKDKNGTGGTILNIASIYGYMSDQYGPFYTASKHAVMGFTRTLGHKDNYKATGVRVMVLCPGVTETELIHTAVEHEAFTFHEQNIQEHLDSIPAQNTSFVAKAAVELLANGQSGSAWSIIDGELNPV